MASKLIRLAPSELTLPLSPAEEYANLYAQWELGAAKMFNEAAAALKDKVANRAIMYPRTDGFAPTTAQYAAYQRLFDYFNLNLFGGQLPQVVLSFSRGRKNATKSIGYFQPALWGNRVDVAVDGASAASLHEISLSPDWLWRDAELTLSTLVHEMCHLQRQITGTPPRGGYHDKEWANMMLEVGLLPVSLDNPGKMTGQKVSHEIQKQGEFFSAFLAMPAEYLLPFSHARVTDEAKKAKKNTKLKYTCPSCEANVWGKSGLLLACGDCASLEDGDEPIWFKCEESEETAD